jgi:hypothetical protein
MGTNEGQTAEGVSSWEALRQTPMGPVVVIRMAGHYPDGSEGNPFAAELQARVEQIMDEISPGGVIFDMSDLEYEWGDALAGIFLPLMHPGEGFVPSRVVAQGATEEALGGLLACNQELFSTGIVETQDEALEQLIALLDPQG